MKASSIHSFAGLARLIIPLGLVAACDGEGRDGLPRGNVMDATLAPLDGGVSSQDGSATNNRDSDAQTDAGDIDPERVCEPGLAAGFESVPLAFSLPASRCGESFDALSSFRSIDYALADLTHDRQLDLVVVHDECDVEIGANRWDVYAGGLLGFSPAPTEYSLPAGRCGESFDAMSDGSSFTDLAYRFVDLIGDQRPDLVVVHDSCDPQVGRSHWDVYEGQAAGFSAAPVSYDLPASRCGLDFDDLAKADPREAVAYALLRLGTESRNALVLTRDECDSNVGVSHWDVYSAGETGFAAGPTSYALPAARCGQAFDWLSAAGFGASVNYAVLDISADGVSDLVVARDDCDSEVGQSRWDVYEGSASGFSVSPEAYRLPTPRCGEGFDALAKTGTVHYSLMDLSCDQRAELVVFSDDCDPEVGVRHWDVYMGDETGFASTSSSYLLPAPRCSDSFSALAGSRGSGITFALLDLLGQHRSQLVVTSDSCDPAIGSEQWDVYPVRF